MTSSNAPGFFSLHTEAGVLRTSIAVTLVVSTAGILFGLLSGSVSITFDGLYSLVDASMSLLALIVVNLINAHTRSRSLSVRLKERFSDVFLVTPAELKQQVDEVAQAFVDKHGFASFRSYVARIGRGRQIEVYFILPPDLPARTIEEWDALRSEVATALGEKNPDRWLIVTFTGDRSWAE